MRLITDAGVGGVPQHASRSRGALSDGSQISVSGTLTGTKQIEKIVEINGYDVEVPFAEHLIVMIYDDRPGIVAVYGKEFGDADDQHRRHADRSPRGRRQGAQRAHRRLARARGAAREAAHGHRRRRRCSEIDITE